MRTDRELLELAAKAIGLDFHGYTDGTEWFSHRSGLVLKSDEVWSPQHDDGDCARMEAALGIGVEWYSDAVVVRTIGRSRHLASYAAHGGDRNAARRDASLQLAAAIGKAMP